MRNHMTEEDSSLQNSVILKAISKIATSTVARLSSDNENILYTPKNVSELENNTEMMSNIVAIKLKNSLIKN